MKQAERIYLISDAAKQVAVEAHVLRYWEEELALPIKRNELGHRYYTQEDIARFKEIRDLKERGLQLKAIRSLLTRADSDSLQNAKGNNRENDTDGSKEGYATLPMEGIKRHVLMVNKGELVPVQEESKEAKSLRLQQLLQTMISEAVRSNNREVCEEIKESLLKELDYQFRLQEEREDEREQIRLDRQEEHYRKVDELIRARNQKKSTSEKRAERREERAGQAKHLEEMILQKRAEKTVEKTEEIKEKAIKNETEGKREEKTGQVKKERNEEKKQGDKSKLGFLRKKRSIV